MGKKYSLYEQSQHDQINANLMALNGADPVSVYKRQTQSINTRSTSSIIVGILTFPLFGFISMIFLVGGIILKLLRRSKIKQLKQQLANSQSKASHNQKG